MKVLYTRISTVDQKTDRQRINESEYDQVIEDRCSGSIEFFSRPHASLIKSLIDTGELTELYVWQIDRLGRNLRDIINTIHYFTQHSIPVHFVSQGLSSMVDGKENPISKMVISILGVVAEMELVQIRERQMQGIIEAKKIKGKYNGRKPGSSEDMLKFLSKPKHKKALEYLKKGYSGYEVAKLSDLNKNTVYKIKQLAKV